MQASSTNTWLQRATNTLQKLSDAPEGAAFKDLKKVWVYEGEWKDREKVDGDCGLCNHKGTRYDFTVRNMANQQQLEKVGSNCIKQFGTVSRTGKVRDFQIGFRSRDTVVFGEPARKLLTDVANEVEKKGKDASVVRYIRQVAKKDSFMRTQQDGFISQLKSRGLSVKQVNLIEKKLTTYKIPYDPSNFQLTAAPHLKNQEKTLSPEKRASFSPRHHKRPPKKSGHKRPLKNEQTPTAASGTRGPRKAGKNKGKNRRLGF
jgi:hypothetical protein